MTESINKIIEKTQYYTSMIENNEIDLTLEERLYVARNCFVDFLLYQAISSGSLKTNKVSKRIDRILKEQLDEIKLSIARYLELKEYCDKKEEK